MALLFDMWSLRATPNKMDCTQKAYTFVVECSFHCELAHPQPIGIQRERLTVNFSLSRMSCISASICITCFPKQLKNIFPAYPQAVNYNLQCLWRCNFSNVRVINLSKHSFTSGSNSVRVLTRNKMDCTQRAYKFVDKSWFRCDLEALQIRERLKRPCNR